MAGRFAVDVLWDGFLAKFLSRIPDGGTLLEVGAGPGLLAAGIIENRPSLKIIVTDYSPQMLDLARANLAKISHKNDDISERPDQVEFAQANAMDLSDFAHRKIEGIYSMGAIKHFPEPLHCLYQASTVLSDGGIMYFADSCSDGTYSGTKAIIAKLNLPSIASLLLRPILHLGLKREAPSAHEVKSWVSDFGDGGEIEVAFSMGGSMFRLMYQKNERPSVTNVERN
jgi:ubiquinone/menaquinone biosynthesis C-methylase UbiE